MKPLLENGVYVSNFVKLEYYFDGVESNYADYYLTFSKEPLPVKTEYKELVFETGDNWYIPETNSWNTSLVRISIENDEIAPLADTVDYSLNAQKIYNDRTKSSIECSIGTINTNTFYHYSANSKVSDLLGRILENYCLNNTYCMVGTLDMNYE